MDYTVSSKGDKVVVNAEISVNDKIETITGTGNGPISAFFDALKNRGISNHKFEAYEEHALSSGADAEAVAYIQLENGGGRSIFGVGKTAIQQPHRSSR